MLCASCNERFAQTSVLSDISRTWKTITNNVLVAVNKAGTSSTLRVRYREGSNEDMVVYYLTLDPITSNGRVLTFQLPEGEAAFESELNKYVNKQLPSRASGKILYYDTVTGELG